MAEDFGNFSTTPGEFALSELKIDNYAELKTKKKSKIIRKFVDHLTEQVSNFFDDSTAEGIGKSNYVESTYLLWVSSVCGEDLDGVCEETLTEAKAKALKRWKKMSQMEQIAFYKKAKLEEELAASRLELDGIKAKAKQLEVELAKEKAIPKEDDPIKSQRKRRKETIQNAPPQPTTPYGFFKLDLEKKGGTANMQLYGNLTDDDKAKFIVLAAKDAKRYKKEYDEYLSSLPEEDQKIFQEKRPRLQVYHPKMTQVFPKMPKAPPINLHGFIMIQKGKKIERKVKKRTQEKDSSKLKFKVRSEVLKEIIEKMSDGEKKKLEMARQERIKEYEKELRIWYKSLSDEQQSMHDRALWIDSGRPKAPLWMDSEPTKPQTIFHHYLREIVKRDLGDSASPAKVKSTMEEIRNSTKMEEYKNQHKEEMVTFEENHKVWLETLNEFQLELYNDYKETLQKPEVADRAVAFCNGVLEKILDKPDEEFDILSSPETYEQLKELFLASAGANKKKSTSKLDREWKRANSEGPNVAFLKKIIEGCVPVKKRRPSSKVLNKLPKRSAFQKRMDKEFGGEGHPPKPQSIYDAFKEEYLLKADSEKSELKENYKIFTKDKQKMSLAKKYFEERNGKYKETVLTWVQSLDEENRKIYQEKHMKTFVIIEEISTSTISKEEDAAEAIYAMDPKTPYAYDPSFLDVEDAQ